MPQNAILYARFSSSVQGTGLSIERQLSEGRQFIHRMGWQIEAELIDRAMSAFSGENLSEGAALHKFEAEARNGLHRGKVLVAENIDRLSRRGARATATLIWNLNDVGVSVATTHDGYIYSADAKSGDMMDLISITLKAHLSYEESLKKSERTKFAWQARHHKIRNGSKAHTAIRAPAWLDKGQQGYILNQHRAKVLNEIYDLYLDGVGISKIVQILNLREEPGWAVRKRDVGTGWREPYVHRLLTSRKVLGEYITLEGETLSSDYFPQAISASKFNQVQATLSSKSKTGGHAYKRLSNLFSGLVVCAECNGMAAYENKGTNRIQHIKKNGERVTYNRRHYERLRCNNARRKHSCSNNFLFDYKVMEACILDKLTLLITSDEAQSAQTKAANEHVAELTRQIEIKSEQINNLVDAVADGSRAIAGRIIKLEAEVDELNDQLKRANADLILATSEPPKISQIEAIEALRKEISDPDEHTRFLARSRVNAALKRIIEKIWITKEGIFLVQGDAADIWLMFDNEGNRLDSYDEAREKWGAHDLWSGTGAEAVMTVPTDQIFDELHRRAQEASDDIAGSLGDAQAGEPQSPG